MKDEKHSKLLRRIIIDFPFDAKTEEPYNYYGERGFIDLVFLNKKIVIELKATMEDFGESLRQIKKALKFYPKTIGDTKEWTGWLVFDANNEILEKLEELRPVLEKEKTPNLRFMISEENQVGLFDLFRYLDKCKIELKKGTITKSDLEELSLWWDYSRCGSIIKNDVLVVWDMDKDERILEWLDSIGSKIEKLMVCQERKGTLTLGWLDECLIKSGCTIEAPSDYWGVNESRVIQKSSLRFVE